ncbi:MAG: molybdenum cofactor guanylyltransferase [Rhodocyclaceae bacterium]|nr:molybdenum cofactor guanylyltransferase [Rhodocyclaceae bacterium]MCA3023785.1 molybdenum cofactor guanylyltransferase [Rhodocyclaceae bacterium]MCA3027201.1 molybdenum cofactor guanylyltransferase [Rhodocyclaceae bacterium]MCA3030618.1 molybdenum cofactor guanylyltransferase [Rhodocyclaceae bacterium]MCA3035772.1 molybdenum cofactor guanylyltransferase [Rhodocyclaceae bacterium]
MSEQITGLILAGGRGSRMGETDKGLQLFRGKPMIEHVLERFGPQVDETIINANRNLSTYEAYGYRVVADGIDGFAGPLAGLHVGMLAAALPLIATAPCDSPFLPLNLIARLHDALTTENADLAVAKTFDQPHPVFCLTKTALEPHLREFLQSGQRKIDKWYASLNVVEVQFDSSVDAFANINTVNELRDLEPETSSGPIGAATPGVKP